MPSARRDLLRELALLLRAPEPGATNLSVFVTEHADDLGAALHVDTKYLRAFRGQGDELVSPHLHCWLDVARRANHHDDEAHRGDRALRAASLLGSSARWTADGAAALDVSVLLGELLVDKRKAFVSFRLRDESVTIGRETLARVASVRRRLVGLSAVVDDDGLHFRWQSGRGGYNWKSQCVPSHQRDHMLDVVVRPPARPSVIRPGAWLGEVLHEVGLLL